MCAALILPLLSLVRGISPMPLSSAAEGADPEPIRAVGSLCHTGATPAQTGDNGAAAAMVCSGSSTPGRPDIV